MEQYIIVEVRDSKSSIPPKPVFVNGVGVMPISNLGKIRKAIHKVSEEQFISVGDMVTHTPWMTEEESNTVERIFKQALRRAKENPPRYY